MNKKEIISKSDFIISLGTMLSNNKEEIRNSIIESIAKTNCQFVYMHPIDNIDLKLYYTQFVKYEVGSEEGIFALLLDTFAKNANEEVQTYIDNLDLGYISAETSAGEEEFEEMLENSSNSKNKTLIIGDDILEHDRIENIIRIIALLKKYTDLNIIVLNDDLEQRVNNCDGSSLEEIADLKSFDGTLVYRLLENESNDDLISSVSFANIAKVSNNDEIYINYKDQKVKKKLVIDEKLQGTIAIAKILEDDNEIFNGYRYKQVKIQKVDA